MNFLKPYILFFVFSFSFLSVSAQQDPENLFLVDLENIYEVSKAGKTLDRPSVGDRSLSAEEVLMYEVLNSKLENGAWVRYTANPIGKGTIKVGHPFLDKQRKRIFFVSDIGGGAGGFDIYFSEKIDGGWSDPTNIGLKVNSPADELFPFVTDAGILQIYRNSVQVNFDLAEVLGVPPITQPVQEPKPQQSTTPVTETKETEKGNAEVAPVKEAEEVIQKPVVSSTSEVEYRVQLGAFSKPNWEILNQVSDLGEMQTLPTTNGLICVHLGAFTSLEEAKKLADRVKMRPGFGNAYVVSVRNSAVIAIHR